MEYHLGNNEDLINELVTLRKRNKELEFMLDTFFNSSPLGLCVLDQELRYVRINERLAEINGVSVAEHLGRTLRDVLPRLSEQAEQPLRNVLATGEAQLNIQLQGETPAHPGEHRFWEEKWFPIKDDLGQVLGISVIVEDVTSRILAKQELRASEEKLRLVLENSVDAINMLDLATGKYIFMSPAQVELTGFTTEEINNISAEEAYDRVHPDDRHISVEQQKLVAAGIQDIYDAEYRWKVKSGEYRWFSDRRKPIRDGSGKPYALVGISRDITERKRAEEALKRSEAKYRTLFNSMDEGQCVIDVIFDAHGKPVDWLYLEVNPAFEKHCGLRNAVGKRISELAPEIDEHWLEIYGKLVKTGIPVRSVNEFKTSNTWFEVNAYKIGGEKSKKVGVTFHDITERKKHENAIAFQAELLANVHDAVVVCDENERLIYVNKSFELMFGWTAQEVVGRAAKDFVGSYLSVESRDIGNMQEKITADASKLNLGDFTCYSKSGSMIVVNGRSAILKGTQGEYKGCIITLRDVSERKRIEENLLQSDANKSHFLSMLSHELRNPLASIMMGIELLKGAEPGGIQEKQAREIMERQGKHLTRLVDDLLDITRISENKLNLRKERFDLNALIQQVAEDHQRQFVEKGVRLAVELVGQSLPIEADRARMVQVVGNLLHNALKFTQENDNVTLAVTGDPITKEAVIRIKDTGAGISPELLPKLFEPFVQADTTLARSSGGLGLGLAIAKGMVQLHGGTIMIESEGIGKGTRFVIRLPLTVHVDNHDDQAAEVSRPSQTLRILVIDDIPDLADILASLLGFLGHTAETALSGTEGIAKAKASKPDVIICDIGLPDMSGYEVARSIQCNDDLRNVRMIALSGYAQEDDREKAMAAGFTKHAAKPVDMDILQQLLSEIT